MDSTPEADHLLAELAKTDEATFDRLIVGLGMIDRGLTPMQLARAGIRLKRVNVAQPVVLWYFEIRRVRRFVVLAKDEEQWTLLQIL